MAVAVHSVLWATTPNGLGIFAFAGSLTLSFICFQDLVHYPAGDLECGGNPDHLNIGQPFDFHELVQRLIGHSPERTELSQYFLCYSFRRLTRYSRGYQDGKQLGVRKGLGAEFSK